MSSFKVVAYLLCFALLSGCGFRPLYGGYRHGQPTSELPLIRVSTIDGVVGQQTYNHLRDLINPTGQPRRASYRLDVTLRDYTRYFSVRENEASTRANFNLEGRYTLYRAGTVQTVTTGKVKVVSSYNIIQSDFGTESALRDAQAAAARMVADDITTELAVFFVRQEDLRSGKPGT